MGSSEGDWELVGMDEFLTRHSPTLALIVSGLNQFPPFHILNEELMTGGRDLGMSGGCFWKPFQITQLDYDDLREEMLSSPKYKLEFDEALQHRKSLMDWFGGVTTKHAIKKSK